MPSVISFRLLGGVALLLVAATLGGCGSKDETTPTVSIAAEGDSASSTPEKPRFNLHPRVQVKTSLGDFVIELNAEEAPLSVDNFLNYVSAGHYDGTIFHQVYADFIALGGGFDAQLLQKPVASPVRNEAHNGLKNRRGTVALARQAEDIDSATSQFFINLADNTPLDYVGPETNQYGYCVFGEVVEGLEVVEKIGKAPVQKTQQLDNVPVQTVRIDSIRRIK